MDFSSISTVYCLIGVIILLGLVFLVSAIKIVPEYQRLVVFRFGRSIGAKGGYRSVDPFCRPCCAR